MLVSIITINYNNLEGLKKTIQSVLDQSYHDIEYMIIDGGSDDGSLEHIKNNSKSIASWVSEPDSGIYEAMNKGIKQSTGKYLLFLNSGDRLANRSVIEDFVSFQPDSDIVYGDPLIRDGLKWKRKHMPKEMNLVTALTHTLAHQAQFYRNSLFDDDFKYDTTYDIVSDWILTTNAVIFKKCTIRYINLVVCKFENAGISGDFGLRQKERNRYLKENFNPLFLDLLSEYKKLHKRWTQIRNIPLLKQVISIKKHL